MRIAIDPTKCLLPKHYAKICYTFLTLPYIHNKEIGIVNSEIAKEVSNDRVFIDKSKRLFSRIFNDSNIPSYEEFEEEFYKSKTCLCSGTFDMFGECYLAFIARNTYPEEYPYPIMIEDSSEKFTDITVKLAKDLEKIL